MSDNDSASTDYEVPEDLASPVDYFLDSFLDFADAEPEGEPGGSGITMPISLVVGGSLVHGELIPMREWLRLVFVPLVRDGFPGATHFERLRDAWVDDDARYRAEVEERTSRGLTSHARRFVHLRDAVLVSGTHEFQVGPWRGRIDQIEGWALGRPGQ